MSKFSVITVYAVSACFLLHSILSGLLCFFVFFPLLVRLCTKYEMHRGREEEKQPKKTKKRHTQKKRNTTARSRTWTGSLCGEKSCSPFIHPSLRRQSGYLCTTLSGGRAGRVEVDERSISLIKAWGRWGFGGRVSWANWARTSYAETTSRSFGALLGS